VLKILHISDVHLGAKLAYLGNRAEAQRREIANTLERTVNFAIKEKVDLVLIAGDLFNSPYPSLTYRQLALNLLGKLKESGIYLAIISGNHDPASDKLSVFGSEEFQALQDSQCKIFTESRLQLWQIPDLELELLAYGVDKLKSHQSVIKENPFQLTAKYKVGLFHGTVDIFSNEGNFPLEREDMSKLELQYIALGDWHNCLEIKLNKGLAYYSGALEIIDSDQDQAGFAVLVEIGEDVKATPVKLGKRLSQTEIIDMAQAQTMGGLISRINNFADPNLIFTAIIKGTKTLLNGFDAEELHKLLADKFFYLSIKMKQCCIK
jgi:DNA repair exonuclease SbcCD nuclease subunit